MGVINHCLLKRKTLCEFTQLHGIESKVLTPEDGETLVF